MEEFTQPYYKFVIYDDNGVIVGKRQGASLPDDSSGPNFGPGMYTLEVDDFPDPDRYYVDGGTVQERPGLGYVGDVQNDVYVGDTVNLVGVPEGSKITLDFGLERTTWTIDQLGTFNYVYQKEGEYLWTIEQGSYKPESGTVIAYPTTQMEQNKVALLILDEEQDRIIKSNWSQLSDSNLHPADVTAWKQYRANVRLVKQQYAGADDYGIVQWPDPSTLAGYPSGY